MPVAVWYFFEDNVLSVIEVFAIFFMYSAPCGTAVGMVLIPSKYLCVWCLSTF